MAFHKHQSHGPISCGIDDFLFHTIAAYYLVVDTLTYLQVLQAHRVVRTRANV